MRNFFKLSTISGKDIIPDNITADADFENIEQCTNFIKKLNPEMIQEYWKIANQLCAEKLLIKSMNNSLISYLTVKELIYIKTANYMVFRHWIKYEIHNDFDVLFTKKTCCYFTI